MKSIIDIPQSTILNPDHNNLLQNKVSLIPIEGYIRSWLSLIGNVVGLKVGIDSFK